MVRPDISAVVPMEMRIVVVEKLRCSSVTMTAAVEPLTMPQMSPYWTCSAAEWPPDRLFPREPPWNERASDPPP